LFSAGEAVWLSNLLNVASGGLDWFILPADPGSSITGKSGAVFFALNNGIMLFAKKSLGHPRGT
jgi:hypothetical protein